MGKVTPCKPAKPPKTAMSSAPPASSAKPSLLSHLTAPHTTGVAASGPASPSAPVKQSTPKKSGGGGGGTLTSAVGATAQCKDGTYWKSASHAGSCSHHGGVAKWL
jgi:hypothetical protein